MKKTDKQEKERKLSAMEKINRLFTLDKQLLSDTMLLSSMSGNDAGSNAFLML